LDAISCRISRCTPSSAGTIAIFFAEDDYACYRDWLAAPAAKYDCAIHPSVLMANPMHLLVTLGGPQSLPRTMQSLGRRTVRHVNARVRGTGREGRYRAAPIDSEACFLACCRTIALNEVACAHGSTSPR
jgi:putative transposase